MNLLCVLLGGFIGGSLRYSFTRLIPAPYCTFVANILGSLALGLAYGFTQLADAPLIGWVGMGHGLLFDPDTCHVTRLPS